MPSIQLPNQIFSVFAVASCDLTVIAASSSASVANLYSGMIGYLVGPGGSPASTKVVIQSVPSSGVIRCRLANFNGTGIGGVGTDLSSYSGGSLYLESQLATVDSLYGGNASSETSGMLSNLFWYKDSDDSEAEDLSETQYSSQVKRPGWASKACLSIGWTAPLGEEPIGALMIKLLGSVSDASGVNYPLEIVSPAGSADGQIVVNIELGGAPGFYIEYTRTSGGTGAVWTGANGTGQPTITWSV
jgi:hypothetical protein